MQKWYATLALACGCSIAVASAVSAQVIEIQVQVQQGQAQVVPAQPPQAQFVPVQDGKAMIARPGGPGFGFNPAGKLTPVDAVFVGRVVALEPMDVEAEQTPKGAKAKYRVAVVEVSEIIHGVKKDTKQVRVAFIVQGNNGPGIGLPPGAGGGVQILPVNPPQPAIQPFPGPGGIRRPPFNNNFMIQLQMGQEGLFFVNNHHKEAFFLSPSYQQFVDRKDNKGFDNEVKTAKQLTKVMADPVKGLKSEDKQDRYTAAAVLIAKYRMPSNPTFQQMKAEPIDAEESKLILKAMAEGDWNPNQPGTAIPAPFVLFNQLGINKNDGYNPVNLRTAQEIYQAMQKWCDENNGKYRINRMVVDPNAKGPATGPGLNPNPRPVPLPPINGRPGVQPLPAPVPLPAQLPRNDR
jgi:hypothetical protein